MSTRSYRHMSAEDRETLSLGLAHGHSLRMMARVLGRAPSTVSREHIRNTWGHRIVPARRTPRGGPSLSATATPQTPGSLAVAVCADASGRGLFARADCRTSPTAYPDDMETPLAETIYVGLYVLPRGTLRSALLAALRQARKARRPRSRGTDRRGQIPNMTPIAERPTEVAPAPCRATGKAT